MATRKASVKETAKSKKAATVKKTAEVKKVIKTAKVKEVKESPVKETAAKKEVKKAAAPKFTVSLEELLEAGSHFGHVKRRWNPKMSEYIWTERDGVHVFDLAKTARKLEEACAFLYQAAAEGKRIVMVGTKRQAKEIVKEVTAKVGVPFITERWLGGTLTNWTVISSRVKKLIFLKEKRQRGEFAKYTKKEQILIDREIAQLERFFGGLAELDGPPEVLFIVDTHRERTAVREASSKGVTLVGITDSNADPKFIKYPIPANDDALRSIKLIVELCGKAIDAGLKQRKNAKAAATTN